MKSACLHCAIVLVFCFSVFGVTVTIDPSQPGSKVVPAQMAGTCLPVWNSADLYKEIKKGLATANYRLFRFPNGSTSNGYHWNGSGSYSADGIWMCDTAKYLPGFVGMTKYRGTSKNNYGFSGCSSITDGDTATFWQSDASIAEAMPYCYLEFSMTGYVDSIVILWGDRYAEDFDVDYCAVLSSFYPGPYKTADDPWVTKKKVTGNNVKTCAMGLDSTTATRYLRVIARKYAPLQKSIQIREIYCFSKGKQVTVNVNRYNGASGSQTKVIAMPTSAGNVADPGAAGWKTWHFDAFMDYVNSLSNDALPVICVNYGTGTPEEAAAWVRYANIVKKYKIRFWQVGNEMDGEWEEGGPVSANIYAEKYLQFAKAMKKVDPSIVVLGPVMSNADFNALNSGSYDGKSWMQAFMEYVGAKEKEDSSKYCDGIDFHCYPYYSDAPSAQAMMTRADYAADMSDSLAVWIRSYLVNPDSVFCMMSEFNSSVVLTNLLMKRANGVFLANMYAGHIEKFGSRAMSVVWDSYEEGDVGPLLSWGSTSLFNALPIARYSSMSKAPSSAYWGLYALQNVWIDPSRENTFIKASYRRADSVRAYGIKTGSDIRVLLINVSSDSLSVDCSLTGGGYSKAEVYTWGPAEFNWIGYDKNSYAFPDCGPSSRRVSLSELKTIRIPALSLCVVRYFDTDSDNVAPKIIHFGTGGRVCSDTQRLAFYATVSGGTGPVRTIGYVIDSGKEYTALKALDGAFDGTFENIVDSIPVTSLSVGRHLLTVRAQTQATDAAFDTVSFFVIGKLYPVMLIDNFQDSDFVPVLPGSTPWSSSVNIKNESFITPAIKTRNIADNCFNADFSIVQPAVNPGYENFAQVNSFADSNYIKANAGRFKGITFSYAATHSSATGKFYLHILSRKVLDNKDWCEFYVPLPATGGSWRTVTFGWGDFRQYPWGIQVGMLDAVDVRGFEIRAQGEGKGSFAFDNMAFLGDSGAQINLPVRPNSVGAEGPKGLFVKETRTKAAVCFEVSGNKGIEPIRAFVYSIDGKKIREIRSLRRGSATLFAWSFDRDNKTPVAGGVYFMVIRSGSARLKTSKVVVERMQ
jgi:hypothetical protein